MLRMPSGALTGMLLTVASRMRELCCGKATFCMPIHLSPQKVCRVSLPSLSRYDDSLEHVVQAGVWVQEAPPAR